MECARVVFGGGWAGCVASGGSVRDHGVRMRPVKAWQHVRP